MNHDYSHCLDFNDSCPKKCFRAELVHDLRSRKDMVGVPISWTHYKGTDECPADRFEFTLDEETEKRLYDLLTDMDTRRTNRFCITDKRGYHAEYVKVIRCKDCKHHCYVNKIPYCNLIDYGYGWEDNDFCSRAERKEE